MIDNKTLKDAIHELKKRGIIKTQNDIAEKTGYNKSSISEILNGTVPLSEKFVMIFSSKFGFTVEGNKMFLEKEKGNIETIKTANMKDDELLKRIKELEEMIRRQIELFNEAIKAKNEVIKTKDELISELRDSKEILKQRNSCYSFVEEKLKANKS